jgi:hypothetical protein
VLLKVNAAAAAQKSKRALALVPFTQLQFNNSNIVKAIVGVSLIQSAFTALND